MKKLILGVLVLLDAISVWAMPTRTEVYRNDDLGIVVYKDSDSADTFWYLPIIKLYTSTDGKAVYRKRVKAGGAVDYTFFILPTFPKDLMDFVANEIPGIHNRQQLKPVPAKRFGIQVPLYGVMAWSDDVTDYRYVNSPQLVRLALNQDQAADFDELFMASPGVPANAVISYQAEKVSKYLKVELTYKEVSKAMGIQVTGRYTFTKAEIEANISSYLSNKYLSIKSKGDIKIPDIVEKVIAECFLPSQSPGPNRPSNGGGYRPTNPSDRLSTDRETATASKARMIEQLIEKAADGKSGLGGPGVSNFLPPSLPARGGSSPADDASGGQPSGDPASGTGSVPVPGSLEFRFKPELADRDERFLFLEEQMADSAEIAVISTYLLEKPLAEPERTVVPLKEVSGIVPYTAEQDNFFRSGVKVEQGDQWTITASFSLFAMCSMWGGPATPIHWDSTWPKPDEDLYYRVGSGPWLKVNGRALVGSDSVQGGEIQFYLDRAAIWNKIPDKYRHWFWGVLTYPQTYPQFNVTLTGRHIEVKR